MEIIVNLKNGQVLEMPYKVGKVGVLGKAELTDSELAVVNAFETDTGDVRELPYMKDKEFITLDNTKVEILVRVDEIAMIVIKG